MLLLLLLLGEIDTFHGFFFWYLLDVGIEKCWCLMKNGVIWLKNVDIWLDNIAVFITLILKSDSV